MSSTLRPVATTGVALLSAGMIAASPLVPPPTAPSLMDFPVELTAVGWDDVLGDTVANLSGLGEEIVGLFQGDATLPADPLGLLFSPIGTLLGVTDAIGEIPATFGDILTASSPLDALEGIVNLPAGIVNAFINGIDIYPGILSLEPEGLIPGLIVGVPNTIINLITGDAGALGFDSIGDIFSGLLDLPTMLLDLPMGLLDGLPGFDFLSDIFSTLLQFLIP